MSINLSSASNLSFGGVKALNVSSYEELRELEAIEKQRKNTDNPIAFKFKESEKKIKVLLFNPSKLKLSIDEKDRLDNLCTQKKVGIIDGEDYVEFEKGKNKYWKKILHLYIPKKVWIIDREDYVEFEKNKSEKGKNEYWKKVLNRNATKPGVYLASHVLEMLRKEVRLEDMFKEYKIPEGKIDLNKCVIEYETPESERKGIRRLKLIKIKKRKEERERERERLNLIG